MALPELAEGWEMVLLASLTSQGVVRGRVRANKLLAFLQLRGVPVPIRFRNIQMGPASRQVDQRAQRASEAGLLVLESDTGGAGFERNDYRATEAGRTYAHETILPKLHGMSYGPLVLEATAEFVEDYLYAKEQVLIDTIHRELHLDDREELIDTFRHTTEWLNEWQAAHDRLAVRDPVHLAAAGTVDFARAALESSRQELARENGQSTGPFNILSNAERLVRLLDSLEPLHSKQHKGDKALVKRFDKILNAMERNAEIYGLLHVPTDEEIDALFQEAPHTTPTWRNPDRRHEHGVQPPAQAESAEPHRESADRHP